MEVALRVLSLHAIATFNARASSASCKGKQLGDDCEINAGYLAADYQRVGSCTEIMPTEGQQDSIIRSLVCIACKSDDSGFDFATLGHFGAWGVFIAGTACGFVASSAFCACAWRFRRRLEMPFEPRDLYRSQYESVDDDDFSESEPEPIPKFASTKLEAFNRRRARHVRPSLKPEPLSDVQKLESNRLRTTAAERPLRPIREGRGETIRKKAENAATLIGNAAKGALRPLDSPDNAGRVNARRTYSPVGDGKKIVGTRRISNSPTRPKYQPKGKATPSRAKARNMKWDRMDSDLNEEGFEAAALHQRGYGGRGKSQQPLQDFPEAMCRSPQAG